MKAYDIDGVRQRIAGLRRTGALLACWAVVAAAATATVAAAAGTMPPPSTGPAASGDPYLWLEQVDGARAMSWVRSENAKTLARLEKDPRYPELYTGALALAEAKDRIPTPSFLGGQVFNFWRDADHVRGLWRATSVADYRASEPRWSTVLDLDSLAAAQKANWVWKGAECLQPAERRCLINLSNGGEDAVTVREFDLEGRRFVPGGFELSRSKQSESWIGENQLLIARDWGPGTMTTSGYPFVAKTLRRGADLGEAREVFRGKPDDVGLEVATLTDGTGHQAVLIDHEVTFFEVEHYLLGPQGAVRLDVPLKSTVEGLIDGHLLISLNESWTVGGRTLAQGTLVSIDLRQALADPLHPAPRPIYTPGPRESLSQASATRSQLIVTHYDNVRGRAAVYTPGADGSWSHRPLPLPDNSSIDIVAGDLRSEHAFLSVTGFLTPTTLWEVDTADAQLAQIKELPAKFDASGLVVEQHEATSGDGTRIPYFLVHARAMKLDGRNPTILYAYGGFQVSMTPAYGADIGKLWLERGGVYALANIRGGGEFGPAWHEAGLKTHRQRIYDDFAAVAQDLIATHVTSARHLGIQGGSNGGLLMGVEFTQHPELWSAVDIQVPLLDMLRFEKIAAGSSWVGEYGSVGHPSEREFLASISPYNNLKVDVRYPEPFVWTTTKDDRVGPEHARKFAAKLSAMGVPYLFYEVIEGGHAAGANLKEQAHTTALEMTYFSEKLMDSTR